MKKKSKKITLAESTKRRIKANFEAIDESKLKGQKLAYYQKVKAGKARAASSYRTVEGKLTKYKQEFIKKFVHAAIENSGKEVNSRTVSEYLRNERTAKIVDELYKNSVVNWNYSFETSEKPISNFKGEIYIGDGDGYQKASKLELQERLTMLNLFLKSEGFYSFYTEFQFKEGMSKLFVNLPSEERLEEFMNNYADLLDSPEGAGEFLKMFEEEFGISIIISDRASKKGK